MINDDTDSTDPSDAAPDDNSSNESDGAGDGQSERQVGTSEPRDYTSINPDDDNDNVGPAQA